MNKAPNRTLFFYQLNKLICIKQGDQHRSIFRHADVPLAEHQVGGDPSTALLATDDKGSVLVAADEGDSEDHLYSAYGHDPNLPSARTASGFNGEFFEPNTGLYQLGLGYRAYSPRLNRFLAADSWSPFGRGGLNAYCYCEGDPVNRLDPDGHAIRFFKNGQVVTSGKNAIIHERFWFKVHTDKSRKALRDDLINSRLQQPRRVLDNVTEKKWPAPVRVSEIFRDPSVSADVVHVRALDITEYKRNRAEIHVLRAVVSVVDHDIAKRHWKRTLELLQKNDAIVQRGETLWNRPQLPQGLDAGPAKMNSTIRSA
ncbi:MAG TPA: hypothetical protein DCE25_12375 [Pseudomonas sp.]|nr:hypothetical protein [Pseudomonas sp.]